MRYTVVFDPVQGLYAIWPFLLLGTLFLVVGIVAVVALRKMPRSKRGHGSLAFAYFMAVFSSLLLSVILVGGCGRYLRLRASLNAGDFALVQGTIERFELAVSDREASFEVDGHAYRYRGNVVTGYFNDVSEPRIRDGAIVRIAEIDGQIARLEVAPSESAAGPEPQGERADTVADAAKIARTPMWLVHRYFWVIMLPVDWAMCLFCYWRGKVAELPPARRAAAVNALLWKARIFDLPWIIAGVGALSGNVVSPFSYLDPSPNPFAMAGWLCTITIHVVVGLWLWRTRCQVLIDVCGKLHPLFERPRTIAIVYAIVVLSAIVAPLMALAIVGDLR